MTQGLILFAHGARDPAWAAPFEAVAARVRAACPGWQVRLAYLEFMTPALPEAAGALAAAGCRQVALLPMFLGTGGHVRRDLPLLVDKLRQAHPEVEFALHAAIGENAAVHSAMAAAISDVLRNTVAKTAQGAPGGAP